jgi:hypothetical protein
LEAIFPNNVIDATELKKYKYGAPWMTACDDLLYVLDVIYGKWDEQTGIFEEGAKQKLCRGERAHPNAPNLPPKCDSVTVNIICTAQAKELDDFKKGPCKGLCGTHTISACPPKVK